MHENIPILITNSVFFEVLGAGRKSSNVRRVFRQPGPLRPPSKAAIPGQV
jgi:hypothetical protein